MEDLTFTGIFSSALSCKHQNMNMNYDLIQTQIFCGKHNYPCYNTHTHTNCLPGLKMAWMGKGIHAHTGSTPNKKSNFQLQLLFFTNTKWILKHLGPGFYVFLSINKRHLSYKLMQKRQKLVYKKFTRTQEYLTFKMFWGGPPDVLFNLPILVLEIQHWVSVSIH